MLSGNHGAREKQDRGKPSRTPFYTHRSVATRNGQKLFISEHLGGHPFAFHCGPSLRFRPARPIAPWAPGLPLLHGAPGSVCQQDAARDPRSPHRGVLPGRGAPRAARCANLLWCLLPVVCAHASPAACNIL